MRGDSGGANPVQRFRDALSQRVVVGTFSKSLDPAFIEILGHYDPRTDPAVVEIDTARAEYWVGRGARPSETVRNLMKKKPAPTAEA